MLDEMIPALQSLKRSKILTAEPHLTAALPGFSSKISFLPLLNYLKEKQNQVSEIKASCYRFLIKKFEGEEGLQKEINWSGQIPENQSALLELLGTMLFPMVSKHEQHSFALATPYKFQVFYYSDCFRELFMDAEEKQLLLPEGLTADELKTVECSMIYEHVLEKFYGTKLNESPGLIYPVSNKPTGLKKFYRIRYDRRFIDIKLKGTLPPLKDCAVCMNTFRILDLEKQLATMPLDLFESEGFAVWVAEDVTTSEALETIKQILLRQHTYDSNIIQELKDAVHALVGLNDIEIGLMPFIKVNDQFVMEDEFLKHSIAARQWRANDPESVAAFNNYTGFLNENAEPMPVSVVNEYILSFAPFLAAAYENGTRSYITYPMQNSDGLIGLLELSSPVKNLLTNDILDRLEPVIPLLSVALLKYRDHFHNTIETLIKEKFTALQKSVEWKFTEVAWNQLRSNNNGFACANVSFDDVYPLYGAIDIRNSSLERNQAIQKDLVEHLHFIIEILNKLQAAIPLPLLEGLTFKTRHVLESISDTFKTGDEMHINEFIENEVLPLFGHLQKSNKASQTVIDTYFKKVNEANGMLCRHRREYEATLGLINNAVLEYLEKEEEEIQHSYPHYFERYRTDGVDYNIYIGQSISPAHPFDLFYLKNIRLWQLRSMGEIANLTHRLLPEMKVPLQTTQLILVHSQCLTISFRNDERRFDVEGTSNIRYETIKKRLDKAVIKDTGERLTQPGKIAIVYSTQKELQEYQEYIRFLQNKNILLPGMELLELEEMQGIQGLKAIRVEILFQQDENDQQAQANASIEKTSSLEAM